MIDIMGAKWEVFDILISVQAEKELQDSRCKGYFPVIERKGKARIGQ